MIKNKINNFMIKALTPTQYNRELAIIQTKAAPEPETEEKDELVIE
jgi:hypothetical protein